MECSINGKKVILKDRVSVRDSRGIGKFMGAAGEGDEDAQIKLMSLMIQSWDFDGDPRDVASYDNLDIFSEFFPLLREVSEVIVSRMAGGQEKN